MTEQIDVELTNPDAPVVVNVQDFLPLYSQVHVWGLFPQSPLQVAHGTVCSPLLPYYHGHNLASGYLVKLDKPMGTIFSGQDDELCQGEMQVVFVHHSALEFLGEGLAPTEGVSNV